MNNKTLVGAFVVALGVATTTFAQQAPDGAAAFTRACASCHREIGRAHV